MFVIKMSSTKAKIPAAVKNRNHLIGDLFESETSFVSLLLATTGRPALSCSLFPTKHVGPDLQISTKHRNLTQPSLVFPSLPGLCEESVLCSH